MYSIGLYDWDLLRWRQPIVFNLDLMKVAAYYKNRRHLVKMLSDIDLERYSKIILTKDYWDDDFPKEIFLNRKVELLGLTVGKKSESYLAEEIEFTTPDTTIYNKLNKYYNSTPHSLALFKTMSTAAHARLSRNNSTIAAEYERQFSNIDMSRKTVLCIHDPFPHEVRDFVPSVLNIFNSMSTLNKYVFFKHPVLCHDEETYLNFARLPRHKMSASIVSTVMLADEVIYIAKPTNGMLFEYQFDNIEEEKFLLWLPTYFKQAMFYGGTKSPLLLNIMNAPSNIKNEWVEVIALLNEFFSYYANAKLDRRKTFYKYCKTNPRFLKGDLIRLFSFVRENNYELFKLFYECEKVVFKNDHFESRYIWRYN